MFHLPTSCKVFPILDDCAFCCINIDFVRVVSFEAVNIKSKML